MDNRNTKQVNIDTENAGMGVLTLAQSPPTQLQGHHGIVGGTSSSVNLPISKNVQAGRQSVQNISELPYSNIGNPSNFNNDSG